MKGALKFDIKLQRKDFLLDVQAEIRNGITGVYGPSGHGKTSLLNCISGLIKPNSGYININGGTVFNSQLGINIPVKDRKVGYVFQDVRLFPHLSVNQNLIYGMKKASTNKVEFQDVIEILEIADLLNKKPSECSGGEKQRISIGRALLSGAQILMMDEPFSAVDVNLRNNIIPFLNALNTRFEIPMLIVSHDLPDLLSLTSDLLLLKDGKIKAYGKFQDLIIDESNVEIMKVAGIYNNFDLFVFKVLPEKNMVLLKSAINDFQVQTLHQSLKQKIEAGMKIKVLIRPEDISVSLKPVTQISLRNQVQGTIEKIFSKDGLSFCLVNAGEMVLVEITEASLKNMNLEIGKSIYCLFKSAALKIF